MSNNVGVLAHWHFKTDRNIAILISAELSAIILYILL